MSTLFTKDHEWIRIEGEAGTIGITAHAADQLGDITFIELPEEGDSFEKGEELCNIESVKAASDIYMPMSGEVVAVNEELEDAPEIVNESAEDKGWMVRIKITEDDQDGLMDKAAYDAYLATLD